MRCEPGRAGADRGREQGGVRADGHEGPALLEPPGGGGAVDGPIATAPAPTQVIAPFNIPPETAA